MLQYIAYLSMCGRKYIQWGWFNKSSRLQLFAYVFFKNIYFEEDLRWLVNQPNHSYDTRIYNLNSVPQITRFSIAGRKISSKTRVGARRRREAIMEVKNKTITVLLFIGVLCVK